MEPVTTETFLRAGKEPTLKWEEWREYFLNYISTLEEDEAEIQNVNALLRCR